MKDTNSVRALGKALEELGECTSAVARCLIQGIDEREPISGKPNYVWLSQEIADVYAQFEILIDHFNLDLAEIHQRRRDKVKQMEEWRAML
jgi:NTP pyrophosphatase (non-canonical NTP hydrolase)